MKLCRSIDLQRSRTATQPFGVRQSSGALAQKMKFPHFSECHFVLAERAQILYLNTLLGVLRSVRGSEPPILLLTGAVAL